LTIVATGSNDVGKPGLSITFILDEPLETTVELTDQRAESDPLAASPLALSLPARRSPGPIARLAAPPRVMREPEPEVLLLPRNESGCHGMSSQPPLRTRPLCLRHAFAAGE